MQLALVVQESDDLAHRVRQAKRLGHAQLAPAVQSGLQGVADRRFERQESDAQRLVPAVGDQPGNPGGRQRAQVLDLVGQPQREEPAVTARQRRTHEPQDDGAESGVPERVVGLDSVAHPPAPAEREAEREHRSGGDFRNVGRFGRGSLVGQGARSISTVPARRNGSEMSRADGQSLRPGRRPAAASHEHQAVCPASSSHRCSELPRQRFHSPQVSHGPVRIQDRRR